MDTKDIEESLLGTLLRTPEYLPAILNRLQSSLFTSPNRKVICEALMGMSAQELPIDLVTLWHFLQTHFPHHTLEGPGTLSEMIDWGDPSKARISHYLGVLEQAAMSRVLRAGAAYILETTEEEHDPGDVLNQFEIQVTQHLKTGDVDFKPSQELIMQSLDVVDLTYQGKIPPGVPTGLVELDRMLGGWHKTDFVVVGGRPGMGKTAFLIHTLLAGAQQGKHMALVSLEMSGFDLSLRLFGADNPKLHPEALRRGQLTSEGWTVLTESASRLSSLPMSFLDTTDLTLTKLRRHIQSLHSRLPVDCLLVDYVQLMEPDKANYSRQKEVTDISKGFKRLAKLLNIPVVVAASLNRDSEKRNDKRPILADLRESGHIESDADQVIFLYRDELYDPDTPDKGKVEILIRKNRHGPTGEIKVHFHGPTMTFS